MQHDRAPVLALDYEVMLVVVVAAERQPLLELPLTVLAQSGGGRLIQFDGAPAMPGLAGAELELD
jgi:hypothetical protein